MGSSAIKSRNSKEELREDFSAPSLRSKKERAASS